MDQEFILKAYQNINSRINYLSQEILKLPDGEQINYGFETLDNNNYERIYNLLEDKKKEKFKNKIKKEETGNNLHIDNFYIAAANLILFLLKIEDFETSNIYLNFYENICQPLYDKNKYFAIIQFLFEPKKFIEIKEKYNINSRNIESILIAIYLI